MSYKKLNFFIFFALLLKHPCKIFYSTHLFFLLFGLDTYKHAFEICTYLSSHFYSKTPYKTKNSEKNPRKMHFPATGRPKFQIYSLWCLPWGFPTAVDKSAYIKARFSITVLKFADVRRIVKKPFCHRHFV